MSKSLLQVVIVGAGPYGLSVAAHFKRQGISFRIFGRLMDSWLGHMPKGMMLKSDGFASDIYDPDSQFTLKRFCAARGVEYADTGVPVRLETFTEYGRAFKERMVPELEDKLVAAIDRSPDGFLVQLDDGETVKARQVVLAVGITHFEFVPDNLAHLPSKSLSHSSQHYDLDCFQSRKVVVIGGGSSALDLAGLLNQAGVDVQLVSRRKELKFHTKPNGRPRSWWHQIRHPQSGLGPGLRSRFFANAPWAFHYLPESLRLELVRKTLGPSGGWFVKDMVIGRVPLMLGHTVESAESRDGMVQLNLRAADGAERTITCHHVIAATGYKVRMERLKFLSKNILSKLKVVEDTPVLSSNFESSVPGLYFVGIAAANSFGPVMRFAFGAGFAAERLTRALVKSSSRERAEAPAPAFVTDGD